MSNGFELEVLPLIGGINTFEVVVFQERGDSSDVAFYAELNLESKLRNHTLTRINQTYHVDAKRSKAFN